MTTTVINPATAQPVVEVTRTSREETDAAIDAAHRAFGEWRWVAPADRGRLLRRFADAVDAERESWPGWRWSIPAIPSVMPVGRRATSGTCSTTIRRPGKAVRPPDPGSGRSRHHVQGAARRRRGDRALELPDADRRLGVRPALAAGNTVVLKPAELTPLTAIRLASWPSTPAFPSTSSPSCPARDRWSATASSPTPTCARSCSRGRRRWASG